MTAYGHIQNGVVVLDGGDEFPEGSRVSVALLTTDPAKSQTPHEVGSKLSRSPSVCIHTAKAPRPVVLPIFSYAGTPDIDLTNDRIAEILGRDDASA